MSPQAAYIRDHDDSFSDVTTFFATAPNSPLVKNLPKALPQSPVDVTTPTSAAESSTSQDRHSSRRSNKRCVYKRVSFDVSATEIHEIPHASEYSEEEKAQIWSSRCEERRNRTACMDIVALMDCDMYPSEEEDGICTRGLEPYTEEYVSMYNEHRREVNEGMQQIQDEFDDLLEEPEVLSERLAEWLAEVSEVAHQVAVEIAIEDEAEVRAIWEQ
uniref:Uncharacterized protein n=1 Tax=Craspedostauros australis TaxID=1486917 RepID=A0A6T6I395_9STRA|eukprot:CAMPEP_0198119318 /NCGR_PEP_ID=MMETSP1442-20131203/25074_1 /TAXON_ID= /ORGANISM="Craspedostauros australis, Strain CCMP3328" /LENGTH=215 /DNA_ID=CAMNT_0043777757 /DNA_START=41 /DNA_END=688 /DNA_ORIENTATION=+